MVSEVKLNIKGESFVFSENDTKTTVISKLGEPDDIGGFFVKRNLPLIHKYEGIEFHYELNGQLRLIYKEDSSNTPYLCVPFRVGLREK